MPCACRARRPTTQALNGFTFPIFRHGSSNVPMHAGTPVPCLPPDGPIPASELFLHTTRCTARRADPDFRSVKFPRGLVYSRDDARRIRSHRGRRAERARAFAGAPRRAPAPRFPIILDRPAHLAGRYLDAERGAGVARARADALTAPARDRQRAPVHADPAPVTGRWGAERSLRQAAGSPREADRDAAANGCAGPARLEPGHPLLACGPDVRDP